MKTAPGRLGAGIHSLLSVTGPAWAAQGNPHVLCAGRSAPAPPAQGAVASQAASIIRKTSSTVAPGSSARQASA